ncbi:hypothetical protein GCM10007924_31820 [Sneathiella chinensis]|uniref:Uncharacterized protein n=1 Tax=Sneathiella chinensis TaxID=349750 RepID=A0ABQ5U9V7_9PROT|nr:hypothetical protein GCM10007924_31820 [Sneathiella chinensis]
MAFGTQAMQVGKIAVIHAKDIVEIREIARGYLTGPKIRHGDPIPARNLLGAGIGRIADMPCTGPRRIGPDLTLKAFAGDKIPKHRLRRGGAAYISKTDKKNANHGIFRHGVFLWQHIPLYSPGAKQKSGRKRDRDP